MSLTQLLILAGVALLARGLAGGRYRRAAIPIVSILALYWLQPAVPIRQLDFWLPTVTIGLTTFTWALTRPAPGLPLERETLMWGGAVAGLVLAVSALRYVEPVCCLTPSRPPEAWWAALVLAGIALLAALGARFVAGRWRVLLFAVFGLIGLLIVLKLEPLGQAASAALRSLTGQSPALATAADLQWLGISYVAFRLMHTLRDRAAGRLPALSLHEYAAYVLFFPAITAGPIDRAERFVKDLRSELRADANDLTEGGRRLLLGLFKKFVVADSLSLFALNAFNAAQAESAVWLWVLVYAYAFRIYFDFAGYTDVAIGLGRWLGVRLPENFDRPYLKPNLTAFWNSWHITLAQWFRAYYFNPLTRALRERGVSPVLIIFFGQTTTMVLIGLWHGFTWNFVLWGLWHGLGLFVHNRWLDWSRGRFPLLERNAAARRAWEVAGVLLTFHFVTLGWVWFALPELSLSLAVFSRLFGGG
ncbi:MAG: MBOAT family O-acyltransferase [Anaerolineales bacterium]|nr:MBOAT family O-acyltransferase [Anaerolineales bacterium]